MGSLLLPLLGSVAGKAGDLLVGELLRAWGLNDHRQKLERRLLAVQSVLPDAEAKSRTNAAVRVWMNDLKTAAYKAGDVLDDFRYEALRRRAHIRGSTARKVLTYFTVNSPVVFRLSMSRKLKDVLEKIDELVVEMNKFHFLEHTETPSIVHPQTHSHVDESEIVSKQDEKEQVVNILLNKSDDNKVTVLPIVGMGGIGKTTLAQLVYNDLRVRDHFELYIWVCVSDKFVLADLIRSIIEVAKMQRCDLPENLELLQKELGRVLGKKKFLLVLDDVWNEEERKWDALRSLLWSHAGSGSAIIVTSRSDQVASIMGTIDPHHISPLNEDPSWELFCRKAFRRGMEGELEMISIAKKIVKKCNGLPLAINTMAGLLSSKRPTEWSSVLDSDVWKSDSNETRVALKLSYDHLSSEAKRCFSFCAIFPKDSLMEKDTLIQLWFANDFIASETRGQEIFDELVWRCFIQDLKQIERYVIYRTTTCKMHDLMHDLAESISGNDCSVLQESSPQNILQESTYASSLLHVRHLSVDSVDNSALMKDILSPRTVLFLEPQRQGISLSMAKSKLISLRALKIFDFNSVVREVTHLKHLRYLDLSYSDIVALPEATAMLYSLQTLNLIGCYYLERLPQGMRYMSSLRHVFLIDCCSLERMPVGIGQLNYLQTLTNYVIDSEAGCGIDQLKDLNIGGSLCLSGLTKVESAENAARASMSSKHNLMRLSLDWGYEAITVHSAEEVLEALHPPNRLEVLLVANYNGAKFSSWMQNSTMLQHLSELYLEMCASCKDLPSLWKLPSLRYLSLTGLSSLTSICIADDTGNGECCISPPTFPKLERMVLRDMPKLERWHREVAGQVATVSFPQLNDLRISGCPMLASMPKLPSLEDLCVSDASCKDLPSLWKLPSLRYLSLTGLSSLTSICIADDTGNGECFISPPTFPKLERMVLRDMPKLERWHREVAGQVAAVSFPQLKDLRISGCPMLASMPKLPSLEDLCKSNLGYKGTILVGSVGLQHLELKSCRLHDSYVTLQFERLVENVERVEEELNIIPCRLIKGLDVRDQFRYLFSSEPSQIPRDIRNHFAFVEKVAIKSCMDIVQWPAGELFRNLNCLRSLLLSQCPYLSGSFPSTSDDQGVLLPPLKELAIESCGNLVEIPKLPASLEKFKVSLCPKLLSLPANLGNLTKLRKLSVCFGHNLTRFPDGMYGLATLKSLKIEWCLSVETLPEGLLQQLPTLEVLSIRGCPNLERGFSRGGAYWDLVQAIPDARIGGRDIHEEETAQHDDNSMVRRANCIGRCLPIPKFGL